MVWRKIDGVVQSKWTVENESPVNNYDLLEQQGLP